MSTELDELDKGPGKPSESAFVSNIARLFFEERSSRSAPNVTYMLQEIENSRRKASNKEPVKLLDDLAEVDPHFINDIGTDEDEIPYGHYKFLITGLTKNREYLALYLLLVDYARVFEDHGKNLAAFTMGTYASMVRKILTKRDEAFLKGDKFENADPSKAIRSIEGLSSHLCIVAGLEAAGSVNDAISELENTVTLSSKLNQAGMITDHQLVAAGIYLNLELSRLHEKKGNLEKAIDYAIAAKQIGKKADLTPGLLHFRLASLMLNAGRYDDALEEANCADMTMSENIEIYLLKARASLAKKEYGNAVPLLASAVYFSHANLREVLDNLDDTQLHGILGEFKSDEVLSFTATSKHEWDDSDIEDKMIHLFNSQGADFLREYGIIEKETKRFRFKIKRDTSFEEQRGGIRYSVSIALKEKTPKALRLACAFAGIVYADGAEYFKDISRINAFGYDFSVKTAEKNVED